MNSSLGCIGNLCKSVASFNAEKCLKNRDIKDTLLKPKLPHQMFSVAEQPTPRIFRHVNLKNKEDYFSFSYSGYGLVSFVEPKGRASYVKGKSRFMLSDDLTVKPLCMLSGLSSIMGLNVPLSDIEEIDINIGLKEVIIYLSCY